MKKFENIFKCDSITLNLTNDCNLNCGYCFETHKNNTYMTVETAIKILEKSYKEVPFDKGTFTINLFGGEPFLNWEVIKSLVDYTNEKKYNVKYGVTTNLTILTDEMIDYIDDNDIMLLVSIDGLKEIHNENRCNTYDIVINNIKKLIDRGLSHLIEARMTILPHYVQYTLDGIKELINLGINNICPMFVTDVNWFKKDLEYLEIEYRSILEYYLSILNDDTNQRNISIKNTDEIICNVLEPIVSDAAMCPIGGNRWCSFDTNGDIYMCHQCPTMDKSQNRDFFIGNIFDELIDDSKLNKYPLKASFDDSNCIDCKGKSICKKGCPLQNLREQGSVYAPTQAHCDIYTIFATIAIEFRHKVLDASNIKNRRLNILKENLKLKYYLDNEIKNTNVRDISYPVKIKHFIDNYNNIQNIVIPSFKEYFEKEFMVLAAIVLTERGIEYGR